MSGDFADDSWTPPPLQPEDALLTLRRHLRDLDGLDELRNADRTGYAWQGKQVIEIDLDRGSDTVHARIVKTPQRTPDWEKYAISTHSDLRRFVHEVKRRVGLWGED